MSSLKNSKIRLHIPGIPYTITRDEYSHDAYTGKVLRFSPMMRSLGFEVYHYGIETSTSGATKHIDLMTKEEWTQLRIKTWEFVDKSLTYEEAKKKNSDPTQVISQLSNWSSPLTKEFNARFRKHLIDNYRSNTTDIVCIPLARTYHDAIDKLNYLVIETGIGYSGSYLNYRIFESYAWLSSTLGKEGKQPNNYWFVIPNYFNTLEFNLSLLPKPKQIGFLGRINDLKGCRIIMEIAKRFPHVEFILCGQGDPKAYLEVPNIKYKEPIHGSERSDYLGSCVAVLCLSKFLEPFCGVAVEAQLCGTPVISTDWGAMVETIEQGVTGLRGHTLADYCHGVQMALDGKFDRQYIRDRAVRLYDMYNVARQYDYVFRTILDVHTPGKNGWYSPDTHIPSLLTDKPSDKQARIYICIPYYGAFPNYFQLYLDSLGINRDILTVFLITDIDMSPYTCPDNLVVINMSKADVQKRASKFILDSYNKVVEHENLLKDNYKFVDFKIVYPLLFDDILKSNGVTREDYVGWGDIDLIYGKLSNFIDFKEDYGILGGWHGHFTAIKNTDSFKNNFKTIPNFLELITDNSKTFITDEIAYREPLKAYLANNNIKMFYANAYFCDIAPECFYHLSRPDHAKWEKNFYDIYNSNKNIKYLLYDKAKLTVLYDDGSSREALYCHLQKRKMDYSFKLYDKYYIMEKEFSLTPLNISKKSSNIVIVSGHHPFDTTYFAKQTRRTIETYCSLHSYDFYYDADIPTETKMYALHYRRCQSLIKANKMYPNAQWYIWLDSDVYANRLDLSIESQIDLSDLSIQYHLFHEKVGSYCYPINTGVKIVNKDAIHFEQEIWDNKDNPPWDKFPFEQKAIYEYVLPKIRDKCIIHDPYILNNLYYGCEKYRSNAIFVHMCNIKFNERNSIIRDILSSRSEFSYPSELRIKYGTADIQIDVTDIVIRYHTVNNIMYIPKNDGLRPVFFTDPCVGIYKKIYIYIKDKIYVYDHTTDIYIDAVKSTITANGYITNYAITKRIIIYIHVCQVSNWKDIFNLLITLIKKSKLYDSVYKIRIGVLTHASEIDMELFNDPKFEIIYKGKPSEFERPTLYHMNKMAELEPDTMYCYLHTKGIRHVNTPSYNNVMDWIRLLTYWNIEQWEDAVCMLETNDIYGCNLIENHYSGNFWWANSSYIKQLPKYIDNSYNGPEFWPCILNSKKYSAHNSNFISKNERMGHYTTPYPRTKYTSKLDILSRVHIVLISYGEPFDTVKKLMMDSVVNYSNNNIIIHDYNLEKIKTRPWFKRIEGLPNINNVTVRDKYYWSYKIFCVNEVYEQLEKNDVLFYLDCSQYYKDGFTESIDRLCSIALEKGIIAGSIGNDIKHREFSLCQKINVWKKVYPECNITILEKPHILASWFLLTKNTTNTQFMNDWIKWSMYTDEEFKDPLITEHVTGDQSIFNMLVYKYDLHVFYDKNRGHVINKDKNGILKRVNQTKDTDKLFIKIRSIYDIRNEKGTLIDTDSLENYEQYLAETYIDENDTVLELGARYGSVSVKINNKLKNKTNQVVVEPDKIVWDSLERNKLANNSKFHIIKGFISKKKLDLESSGYCTTSVENINSIHTHYSLEEICEKYNVNFNVLVADCEGFLEIFFDENPDFYDKLRLIIFEADCPHKCNYDKIRKNLKEKGYQNKVDGFQNVWIKN